MEGSSVDNGIVLLSKSSVWMDVLDVLALSMTGSGGDSGKDCFKSWSSADVVSLSTI
jgi:hypothetical protein